MDERNSVIIKYNVGGIIVNLLLSGLKMAIGTIINSQAIWLDGINSFADLLSSVFSIVSAVFSRKKADKKHPFGFGRLEYLSSFLITIIVMYIGIRSIFDAIANIINPDGKPEYTGAAIVIMIISLVLKFSYGAIMRSKGKKINAIGMVMTGVDSMGDSLIALSILVVMVIYKFTGVNIEGVLCIIISGMIVKTGVVMMNECTNKMLGGRIDASYKRSICKMIAEEDEVFNVSNLVIHNYGEDKFIGSVDIVVDEDMKASDISALSRRIINKAEKKGLTLTSVGIGGTNFRDPETVEMWDHILEIVLQHKKIIRAQAFVYNKEKKEASFYIVQDYSLKQREEDKKKLYDELQERYPDVTFDIHTAIDV